MGVWISQDLREIVVCCIQTMLEKYLIILTYLALSDASLAKAPAQFLTCGIMVVSF